MEQNYKMVCILKWLRNGEGSASLQDICDELKISKRVLYYNIDKLNAWLRANHFPQTAIQDKRLTLSKVDLNLVLKEMEKTLHHAYILSKQERIYLICLAATLGKDPPTIDYLCNLLEVSRNTVIGEAAEAKKIFKGWGLAFGNCGKQGYRVSGPEEEIRYRIMEIVFALNDKPLSGRLQNLVTAWCSDWRGHPLAPSHLDTVTDIVKSTEKMTDSRFNQMGARETALYLSVVYIRGQIAPFSKPAYELHGLPEYAAAGRIRDALAQLGLALPEEEQSYIAMILLGSQMHKPVAAFANAELFRRITIDIIQYYEARSAVYFEQREQLIEYLHSHVRTMYYRLKYKIKVNYPLKNEIMEKYRYIFLVSLMTLQAVGETYDFVPNDGEAAYLAAYFGAWTRKKEQGASGLHKKVLIVHNNGIGTSMLLKQELMSILGTQIQYEIQEEQQLNGLCLTPYSLVATTVPLENVQHLPVIRVSPLLTEPQKKELLLWRMENSEAKVAGLKISDILEIISQHAAISDERALISDLARYFVGEYNTSPKSEIRLREALLPSFVRITDAVYTPQESIHLACEALLKEKLAPDDYAASIWESLQGYSLYSLIAPGVLLAHGKPIASSPVALSLTLFRQPVLFTPEQPVRIIFTLVTPNNEKHIFVMQDLHRLLSHPKFQQELLRGNFNSESDVLDYINKVLGEQE